MAQQSSRVLCWSPSLQAIKVKAGMLSGTNAEGSC